GRGRGGDEGGERERGESDASGHLALSGGGGAGSRGGGHPESNEPNDIFRTSRSKNDEGDPLGPPSSFRAPPSGPGRYPAPTTSITAAPSRSTPCTPRGSAGGRGTSRPSRPRRACRPARGCRGGTRARSPCSGRRPSR